jgi:hypothetical protein
MSRRGVISGLYPFAGNGDICDAIKKGLLGEAGDTAVKMVEHHSIRIEGLDRLNNDDKHRLIPTHFHKWQTFADS